MKPMTKAVAVALAHVLLVCSLGAKLLYDRQTRPKAWFKTQRYDPNLPIRGRYVALRLDVKDARTAEEIDKKFKVLEQEKAKAEHKLPGTFTYGFECGTIEVREGQPVAVIEQKKQVGMCENLRFFRQHREGTGVDADVMSLEHPVLFFIPDTAKDPSVVKTGEEVWVLATIPKKGPPRPIQLGIKKAGETEIRPMGLR